MEENLKTGAEILKEEIDREILEAVEVEFAEKLSKQIVKEQDQALKEYVVYKLADGRINPYLINPKTKKKLWQDVLAVYHLDVKDYDEE